jgi:hypothetical protein
MLHIRFNRQGKVEYAFCQSNDTERVSQNESNIILMPRVQNNRLRKKIDDWHDENNHHIKKITKLYLHALHEFCLLNPQYVCSVKEKEIRDLFIHMLHRCSHNSFKSYPSL